MTANRQPSRRDLLRSLGVFGVVGSAAGATTAAEGDHLGETWTGSPDGDHGLTIDIRGTKYALEGISDSEDATVLFGKASADSGNTIGVQGSSSSSKGKGVFGFAPADSGASIGVKGVSNSDSGRGVFGYVTANSGWTRGLQGTVDSPGGSGVFGKATATSGAAVGVDGHSAAPGGAGVKGTTGAADGLGIYTPDDAAVDGIFRAGTHRTGQQPHADVTAHGAAGDGSTDDTDAIRDARDAVGTGDVVLFPSGTFLVSEAIDRKGRAFVGVSPFAATVRAASGGSWGTGGDENATAVLYDRDRNRSLVRSLGVDINGEDASGIACFGGQTPVLRDNYVVGGADSGVQFWGNDASGVADCVDGRIQNNFVENCKWNLVLDGACRNCTVSDNVSRSPRSRHVSVDNKQSADGRSLVSCSVTDNNCQSFDGDYTVGGAGAIQVRSAAGAGVSIARNYVYDWPGNGVKVEDATSITDNVVRGASDNQVRSGVLLDGSRAGMSLKDNVVVEAAIGYNAKSGTSAADVVGNVAVNCGDPSEWEQAYDDSWVIKNNHKYDGSGGKPDGTIFGRVYSSGTVTVSAGNTSAQYSHELMAAPDSGDVLLTAVSSLGNASTLFVSDRTADAVEVSLDTDPGQDVEVAVRIDLNE
jgi:hypothetical protein